MDHLLQNPTFAILLAAYNGAAWITEQIQSILDQQHVDLHIFISIDPSTDETMRLCEHLAQSDHRITLLSSDLHFGKASKNFFRLIKDVDLSIYDYMAFADQDDIWLPKKLITAHQHITEGNYDAYSSNVTAFWKDGRQSLLIKSQPQRQYDFLFEAAGAGCTYVLPRDSALRFKTFMMEHWDTINQVDLHDWMIYAWYRAQHLAWFIDSNSYVLYRQHDHNRIGANKGFRAILNRMSMIRNGWYYAEIRKIWNLVSYDLPELKPKQLTSLVFPRHFMFQHGLQCRRRLRDRLFLSFIILIGLH